MTVWTQKMKKSVCFMFSYHFTLQNLPDELDGLLYLYRIVLLGRRSKTMSFFLEPAMGYLDLTANYPHQLHNFEENMPIMDNY